MAKKLLDEGSLLFYCFVTFKSLKYSSVPASTNKPQAPETFSSNFKSLYIICLFTFFFHF